MRPLLAALLGFCLAFAPLAGAGVNAAGNPCASMDASAPVEDCCEGGSAQAECLDVCMTASAALASIGSTPPADETFETALDTQLRGHASILAPPDITPPKASVS